MYAGLAAGNLIFFILGQMIAKKTPRIFNLRGLRSFGIYILIAIVFIVGLNVDATGFERRVPNINKIDSFSITEGFISNSYNPYNQYMHYNNDLDIEFKDPENIKAITALHQSFIVNKSRFEDVQFNNFNSSVHIEYDTGGAFPMNRRYTIDFDFFRNSPEFKQIYESKEYKEIFSLKNLKFEKLTSIYINTEIPNGEVIELKNNAEISEFMACLEKDFQSQSFEDMVSLKHGYAIANINYKYKDLDVERSRHLIASSQSQKITDEYKNTIKGLEDHGHAGKLVASVEDIQYIEVYHNVQEPSDGKRETVYESSYVEEALTGQGKSLKITDPEQIKEILDIYETQNINYYDYYYGTIVYVGGTEVTGDSDEYIKEMSGEPYYQEMQAKIQDKYASYNSRSVYFNEGNVPDYILEYFK